MPRSKNLDQDRWEIIGPHELVGRTRRKVNAYKELNGITQAQALADLVGAGYAQLVSRSHTLNSDGPNPHGATDGSSSLGDR